MCTAACPSPWCSEPQASQGGCDPLELSPPSARWAPKLPGISPVCTGGSSHSLLPLSTSVLPVSQALLPFGLGSFSEMGIVCRAPEAKGTAVPQPQFSTRCRVSRLPQEQGQLSPPRGFPVVARCQAGVRRRDAWGNKSPRKPGHGGQGEGGLRIREAGKLCMPLLLA